MVKSVTVSRFPFVSKRSMIFGVAFLVAIIFLLSYAFLRVYMQDNRFQNKYVGQDQLAVLTTINDAEKALLYIDQSAVYAYEQAYYDIARRGGYEHCGTYRGVSLWVKHKAPCEVTFDQDVSVALNFALDAYAKVYPEATLPLANYDFYEKSGDIIGRARNPLELDIVSVPSVEYEAPYTSLSIQQGAYLIPKNARKRVQKIYTTYRAFIEQASLESGVEIPLIVGVIAQESGGKESARSEKNAKGLMQLLDGTAQRMAKSLQLGSYDIFDPQTNIRLGTRYLKYIMTSPLVMEDDAVDPRHIPAAYNGGICNKAGTVGALCHSVKCPGQRAWECNLNVGYHQTREYVPLVLSYKKAFEDWQQEVQEAQQSVS